VATEGGAVGDLARNSFSFTNRPVKGRHCRSLPGAGQMHFSRFGPEANLFEELETLFLVYGESGTGKVHQYLHDEEEAEAHQEEPGTFTPWEEMPPDTDMLFYEGLHGAIVTETVNVAQHADLLIGVVPVINLEWIQKLHRDKMERGYTQEAIVDTILRRMPDYMNYICPQFVHTHVNFQRVPTLDTSNPFIARATFRARMKACSSSALAIRRASTFLISCRCCRIRLCRGLTR
jgi:phosphoribulokinase